MAVDWCASKVDSVGIQSQGGLHSCAITGNAVLPTSKIHTHASKGNTLCGAIL